MRTKSVLLATAALLMPAIALAQSVDPNNGFGGAVSDRLRDNSFLTPDSSAPAVISGPVGNGTSFSSAQTGGFRTWGKTFAFQTSVGADVNGPGWRTRGAGVAAGIEKSLAPNWLIGAALGYTGSDTGNETLRTDTKTVSGALYTSYALAGLELNGLAGVNNNDFSSTRILNVFGAPTVFSGGAHGIGYSAYGDVGYRFRVPTALGIGYVKPFVGLNYSALDRDTSTEYSAGGIPLVYQHQIFERFSTLAGVDFGTTVTGPMASFRPEFRLGYLHDYIDPAPLVHASVAGLPFLTKDPEPGRDALIVGAQITAWRVQNVQLFAGYSGEFRSNLTTHQGQVGARIAW